MIAQKVHGLNGLTHFPPNRKPVLVGSLCFAGVALSTPPEPLGPERSEAPLPEKLVYIFCLPLTFIAQPSNEGP